MIKTFVGISNIAEGREIKMDGYTEAGKFDEAINKLLKKHPPTKENARAWLAFTRTVKTSLVICELEPRKALGLKKL